MVPNTALGILLSGLVLVLDGGGQLSRGKRLCFRWPPEL